MRMRIVCCSLALFMGAAAGQADPNQKVVTLLAGEAQWFARSADIALTLQHQSGLNIIPMQGQGCLDSTTDLFQLSAVDVALINSDCVDYAATQGLLPKPHDKLTYISRVASLPLLLVTRRDNATITSLAGKRIATGPANSAGFAAGELILGGLGLPFVRVAQNGAKAMQQLQAGTVDAVLLTGTDHLTATLDAKQFHVLGLTAPNDPALHFAPAMVPAASLAGLANSDVETIASSLLLAVRATSSKTAKLDLFAREYITQTAETENAPQLSATVGGWQRYRAAQKALDALTPKDTTLLQTGGTP